MIVLGIEFCLKDVNQSEVFESKLRKTITELWESSITHGFKYQLQYSATTDTYHAAIGRSSKVVTSWTRTSGVSYEDALNKLIILKNIVK